jgi:hypothetical protein
LSESGLPQEVSPDEILARFIKSRHWIRSSDNSVKPDAFIPPQDMNLSVTRHIGLSEEQLWTAGRDVVAKLAEKTPAELVGRADFAAHATPAPLHVQAAGIPDNPNHAHVSGWPSDKPSQKNIAQRLAALAAFVPFPRSSAASR